MKNLLEITKKKGVNSTAAKKCPYCNNFFLKSREKMKKHISSCAGQSGFNFVFDNGKIVDYQVGTFLFHCISILKQQQAA